MTYTVEWARLDSGLELPYIERGDPAGPPLVLLHGYAESWRSFELLLPELPRTIRAFASSQRGHGGPRTLIGGYSLEAMAADVVAFMDAVEIDASVVVGCSSGGYVAQRLAADRPDRVSGLVLAASPRSLRAIAAIDGFADRLKEQPDPVDLSFAREFVASTLGRRVPPAFLETMISEARAVPKHVWQLTLEALTEAVPPTDTTRIAAPTLVLWGERDEYVRRRDAEALTAAIANATLVVYESAGHALAWEEPRRVAADIAGFVGSLPV